MDIFTVGLILIFVGVFANIRGKTSRFNPPSGGGRRIPPEVQVKVNENVQKVVEKRKPMKPIIIAVMYLSQINLGL